MNIFALHPDPCVAAKMHCDKHCVKMIIEYAQLLSTAHRVLDGVQYEDKTSSNRRIKRWRLNDSREQYLYKATHINHPSAVWTRQAKSNYQWLYILFTELLAEYTHRYGKKHECSKLVDKLRVVPYNISNTSFTMPTPAMPDIYKVGSVVESYRNYYRGDKKRFATWKNRQVPEWFNDR